MNRVKSEVQRKGSTPFIQFGGAQEPYPPSKFGVNEARDEVLRGHSP